MRYSDSLDLTKYEPKFTVYGWIPEEGINWMRLYWYRAIYISLIYVMVIFTIKYLMRNRKPYDLRISLFTWNLFLTIFSLIGTIVTVKEMLKVLSKGKYKAICTATDHYQTQYWIWLFALSKLVELGDTLFIVFRKQKLILLHWTHHAFTLIFTWYATGLNVSLGLWFVSMNYFVHTFMYAYYAARAMRIQIAKPLAATLTALQIIQLAIGFYVSYYALKVKLSGNYCEVSTSVAFFGSFLYLLLFYMFSQFFVKSYLSSYSKKFTSFTKIITKNSNAPKVNDYVKAG